MERSERDNQLQDIIPQHCGESTTGRRFEWVILLVWQNIPHPPWTPPATPLSPTPAIQISEDEVRQVFRKQKRKKAQGTDCVTPVCLKSCAEQLAPIFTKIFNRSLELCEVPSLQTLHHHPHPKEIQNCRTKWLQAYGLSICGHEVIWKTGAGPPEGHHWTLAGSSSVWIQSKKVCGRCSKHWTALCSATSRQTYVRILFVDFSSALNTIIPNLLLPKLTQLSVPTYNHEQHCDCSGVIQIPVHHNLSGPEVGQSHKLHCEKGTAEAVFPLTAEEVQPATGAAEAVLLCHHWIRPLHVNNRLVQLSYQIWPQKTTEGSPDCRANHWYPPHSPRTVLIQSERKGWKTHSGPCTSSTLPLLNITVWSTLQSSEHQNDQTQKQFLPSGNPSHEQLTIQYLCTYLSNTHT